MKWSGVSLSKLKLPFRIEVEREISLMKRGFFNVNVGKDQK